MLHADLITAVTPGPELTIVVPTLDERGNIDPLVSLVAAALGDVTWQAIFVDDDLRDGTAAHVRELGETGLARALCATRWPPRPRGACIEGVLASASPYVAIMDADLQHDEQVLPRMLNMLRRDPIDLVVGSRYAAGGGIGEGLSSRRARASNFATRFARAICKVEIADPMSGFFMFRREIFDSAVHRLSGQGFKILLDLMASSPQPLRVREIPFEFRKRRYGESKLDTLVIWEYGMLLADKLIGHIVPVRFVLFSIVGGLGATRSHGNTLERLEVRRIWIRCGADRPPQCGDDLQFLHQ